MNFNGNFMKILGGLAGVGSALVAANPNNSTGTRTTFAMLAAAVPTITSLFSGGGNNTTGAVNGQNANPSIFGAQQTQQANNLRSMYAAYAGNPTQQFQFVNNMRSKVQQEAQKVQQSGNTMYLKLNSQVNSQLEALKEKLEKKEITEDEYKTQYAELKKKYDAARKEIDDGVNLGYYQIDVQSGGMLSSMLKQRAAQQQQTNFNGYNFNTSFSSFG